jgi:RNA polymerase sigma-70 factor, ECF subfamily
MVPPSDEELVKRHLQGDPEAFAELIDRYSGRLFNLAYRFTGDRGEAEDVAQETFLRVYSALPRSRLELAFRPWLFRIAVNLCRDLARRKRPTPFTDLPRGQDAPAGEDGMEALPDPGPSPADQVETQATEAALRRAVMELPPAQRLIVTLRYNEALSYEEIGRLLDMPPATVGTSLLRARRRLRAVLSMVIPLPSGRASRTGKLGEANDDGTP